MIRPIRNDADHAEAMRRVEILWGAEDNSPEGDALEVLATLIDAYEEKRWPDAEVHPIALLKSIMDDTGRTQADLATLLGSRSRASEILNLRRILTVEMIWKISRSWNIPAELLIKPYSAVAAA
ncbi:MAG: helix-turn-helix domain-containing protein [Beijerinckiaceae bacterium]